MAEPLTYVKDLDGLPHEDVAKVMGGNLAEVMRVPFAA
jgi:DNA-directed RNA polymerase specialized sigma24 family protein